MKKLLYYSLMAVLTFTSIATIIGYFGTDNWFFDLFSHFKFQYFILLLLAITILLFMKHRIGLYFLPFAIITGHDVVPLYFGGAKDIDIQNTVKIVCLNLLSSNGKVESVEAFINSESPDILVLQEMTELWQIMLEPTLASYQYKTAIPRTDNFGIALYSRIERTSSDVINIGESGLPSIEAQFNFGKDSITILATHPLPPVGRKYFTSRNDQLRALSNFAVSAKNELILIGDLNCSSFSNHFKSLIKNTNLIDSRKGFGILPTWPTWFGMAKTTLDHCLISDGISVKSRRVGQFIGSDHLPIIVELGIE
ncbi:MAG: endonuclease/exonuclease/phosphatase family protein [Reichenbachiella sp.]